jgi:hypothetical protein
MAGEPLEEKKSSEEDNKVKEDCITEQRRHPQKERIQKQFPDMVQYMAVCDPVNGDSTRSEPVSLKDALESNECKICERDKLCPGL